MTDVQFKVEAKGFYKWLGKMQKEMNWTIREAVTEGARLFARSAARWTPPVAGRRITRKANINGKRVDLFNRPVITGVIFKSSDKFVPPAVADRVLQNGKLSAKSKKSFALKYIVLRKISGTRKTEKMYFSELSAAKNAAKIHTRGLLRAGWWGTVLHLGESIGTVMETYGDRVAALVRAVSRTRVEDRGTTCSITITNAVREANSEPGKRMGAVYGFGKAKNQMVHIVQNRINQKLNIPF